MVRMFLVLALVAGGCHHYDPDPTPPGQTELPPLPPASGTPVGYLIDSADALKLRDDQLKKLKNIDESLAARDAGIDVQLRQIEKPAEDEDEQPQQKGPGQHKRRPHNNAPGADIQTNGDAAKLHQMRNANDREALKQAWALLDASQQEAAKRILEDRGVEIPGTQQKKSDNDSDDGTPLPEPER